MHTHCRAGSPHNNTSFLCYAAILQMHSVVPSLIPSSCHWQLHSLTFVQKCTGLSLCVHPGTMYRSGYALQPHLHTQTHTLPVTGAAHSQWDVCTDTHRVRETQEFRGTEGNPQTSTVLYTCTYMHIIHVL